MKNLGNSLFLHILKGRWRNCGEADKEDIRLRVGKWPKSIVVLLSSRVKEPKSVRLLPNHHFTA